MHQETCPLLLLEQIINEEHQGKCEKYAEDKSKTKVVAPREERFALFRGDLRKELADPIFLPGDDVDHRIAGADEFVDFFQEGFRHDI